MKKFAAIAHALFGEDDLQIKIVDAEGWKEALMYVSPIMDWLRNYHDLRDVKVAALERNIMLDVVEIT